MPYFSLIAKKIFFLKVEALEMLQSMGLRAYMFGSIAFNISELFEEMFQIRAR
jgi:hypothetical protein